MTKNKMENNQSNNKIFIYLLVMFFAFFIGTSIFLIINKQQPPPGNETETPTVVPLAETEPTEGTLNLVFDQEEETSFPKGEEITINLEADSMEKNIVGYDVVLSYDPLAFEFVKATSVLADFKIYSYKKDSYLTLLGTKILQSQTPSVFDKTKIVSLVFRPLKAGQFDFALKPVFNKDKTDFITDETKILSPALNELKVEIN
ncbi:MAG: cohesin domain-containing protein [Candidatus Roizmanbacteria bacterium]